MAFELLHRTRVQRFMPSYHGFLFSSAQLAVPDTLVQLPGGSQLPLSSIAPNLSGGLAYMAADYYWAGARPPQTTVPPLSTDPLMNMLINRQLSSFDPGRVSYIFGVMSPNVPSADPEGLSFVPSASRARAVLLTEWPRIERDLRLGLLVPLAIIATVTPDARIMGYLGKQVMCYGYDLLDGNPRTVTLWLYDPNLPGRDDVQLRFDLTPTSQAMRLGYSDDLPVAAFFHAPYAPQPLPPGAPVG